ncbi:MAG: hypothetical protein JOZ75_14195 [Candidatus Dormibacteraeota bacterium]|nr:hypothetical protein [Candidatus Dormibacteraeota bacterium]
MPGMVDRVVILFFENHTLDNVASEIKGVNGDAALPVIKLAKPPHDYVVPDIPHNHVDWENRATGAKKQRFTRAQLPNLMALMDQYCICDNYFTDYAGNSFPNHCFAIGADAEWAYTNPTGAYKPVIQAAGVPKQLNAAGKTWANYGGFAFAHYADPLMQANAKQPADFLTDAAKGALPNVSWVYGPSHHDFHPGSGTSMSASDTWMAQAVQAVATGAQWGTCMIFITFDDWGGWFDHVASPDLEQFPAGTQYPGTQYRYGPRVPCIVVGPYAKPKHVSSQLGSHTSLVAFVRQLWNLAPSDNADARRRVAADLALGDTYNLAQTPNPKPVLPKLAGVGAAGSH